MDKKIIRFMLWAMSQPRTFYILGAGASYGLIPFTPQLRSIIKEEYHKIGGYPTEPTLQGDLFSRVIGNVKSDSNNFHSLLLRNIPLGTLDLLVQRSLWIALDGNIPSQYAIFDIVGQPSTIFTYNLDGLASIYCRDKHKVIEPHGAIDRFRIESPSYKEYLYATSAFGFVLPHLSPKLFPSPEPTGITETKAFINAREFFIEAPVLIVIAYSFGFWNGKFDDAESLEYFIDLLQYKPKPVLVLSPSPDELVEIFQERLSSYNIYGLSSRWEIFTTALLKMPGPPLPMRHEWTCDQVEELKCIYYQANEKSNLTM